MAWWYASDDLRPYAVAQFLPMLLIPLMLARLPGRRPAAPLVGGIAPYANGRLPEVADRGVFALGGVLSAQTVKHVLSTAAAALILRWLVPRHPGKTP